MKINSDVVTTVLGATVAAIVAAQPAVNAVGGSFGQDDLIKVILAVVTALWGFFTNRTVK